MDCKIARRLMEVCRPSGEDLVAPELAVLGAHLEECPECLGRLRARQAFDSQIVKALRCPAVPEGLRERILDGLNHSVIRTRRLKAIRFAAAALLLVGAGLLLWRAAPTWGHKHAIRFDELAVLAKPELEGGLWDPQEAPRTIRNAPGVKSWCVQELEKLNLNAAPPEEWPLTGLMGIARADLEGRRVAVFRYDDPSSPGNRSAFVFAWPRQQLPILGINSSPKQIPQTGDLTAFAWMEGEMNYVAVFMGGEPKEWQRLRERQRLT